jgi:hypothetical protein
MSSYVLFVCFVFQSFEHFPSGLANELAGDADDQQASLAGSMQIVARITQQRKAKLLRYDFNQYCNLKL